MVLGHRFLMGWRVQTDRPKPPKTNPKKKPSKPFEYGPKRPDGGRWVDGVVNLHNSRRSGPAISCALGGGLVFGWFGAVRGSVFVQLKGTGF